MTFPPCLLFFIITILIDPIGGSIQVIELTTQSLADAPATHDTPEIDDEFERNQTPIPEDHTKIFHLNVGGEIIVTTRQTLTKIPLSTLCILFSEQWQHELETDKNRNIFLDFNPILFHHLLDQLQTIGTDDESIQLYPPSQPSLIQPFKKMLTKLGLQQLLSSEKINVITFTVGGQTMTNRRTTFAQASNSTFDTIVRPSKTMHSNDGSDVFVDCDPKLFRHLIDEFRKESFRNLTYPQLSSHEEKITFKKMLKDLNIHQSIISSPISNNAKWNQNGVTVAGGHETGNGLHQLFSPNGICVDDDNQCIYIVDWGNQRVVQWKFSAQIGEIVAGGHGQGNRTDQLNNPSAVILDQKGDTLIICDRGNRRVVRWSRQNRTSGQTIISNISCYGLAMDNNEVLYVSDTQKNEVRRWKIGEKNGTLVAGGNKEGNQLNHPTHLFVDADHSLYVSDQYNHRVIKWSQDAKEGLIVAGGQGQGNALTQLFYPTGIVVDQVGNVYVADSWNYRVMCWSKGSKQGRVIVGGHGTGKRANQLSDLGGIVFDRQDHLYVVDRFNGRVQTFEISMN